MKICGHFEHRAIRGRLKTCTGAVGAVSTPEERESGGLILGKHDLSDQCANKEIHPLVFLKSNIVQRKVHHPVFFSWFLSGLGTQLHSAMTEASAAQTKI